MFAFCRELCSSVEIASGESQTKNKYAKKKNAWNVKALWL